MEDQDTVVAMISLLEEWFQAVEDGTANQRLPDLSGKRYSEEQADKLIDLIDNYVMGQIKSYPSYWEDVGMKTRQKHIDAPADFNRLQGAAREAFAQAVYARLEELDAAKGRHPAA